MLDAETKRRIGVLGTAALSSLALSMGLRPWLRAVAAFAAQHCAELSMGLRPRLSAAAASRLVWNPRAGARESNILSRGNMDRQDEKLLHAKLTRSIIACAFEVINELGSGFLESDARQGPLSGEAVWRQTILFILSIHVNQGSTHARRRNQTPQRGFRHSGPLQFGAAELRAVAAFAAQHCAELSMGLRPRLSAAAASRLVWSPRAGARGLNILSPLSVGILGRAVKPRLAPMATCCRRLRGSMEWGHPVPWAYAHG